MLGIDNLKLLLKKLFMLFTNKFCANKKNVKKIKRYSYKRYNYTNILKIKHNINLSFPYG